MSELVDVRTAGVGNVKYIITVLSGKGGVGKSTTVSVLAHTLAHDGGYSVGIIDADLCGPSVARMIGVQGNIHSCEQGWLPLCESVGKAGGKISAVSLSYLVENQDEAVIWRGPKKTAMIRQFINDVCWGELDFLLIDTPPGTSDEHMTIMELLPTCSVVLVTSPQAVAVADVLRQVTFCKKANVNVLGIIETLSGFVCPNCSDCGLIFSKGGGQKLAEHCNLKYLGSVPIDPNLSKLLDTGTLGRGVAASETVSYASYLDITNSILHQLNLGNQQNLRLLGT